MMRVAMGSMDTQGAGWTDARFPRNDLDVVQLCHGGTKIDKPHLTVKVFLRNIPVNIVVTDEAGPGMVARRGPDRACPGPVVIKISLASGASQHTSFCVVCRGRIPYFTAAFFKRQL